MNFLAPSPYTTSPLCAGRVIKPLSLKDEERATLRAGSMLFFLTKGRYRIFPASSLKTFFRHAAEEKSE